MKKNIKNNLIIIVLVVLLFFTFIVLGFKSFEMGYYEGLIEICNGQGLEVGYEEEEDIFVCYDPEEYELNNDNSWVDEYNWGGE